MTPYEEEFTRLKAGDETRKIARKLYLKASELTKPGSGRSLGQGQIALAAVCAFLASKRLGNGEVTRDQACAVACVDTKTFDATLAMAESDLCPSHFSSQLNKRNITYWLLVKEFVDREDAFVPMVEVENALKGCGELVDGCPIDIGSSLMQCAIFYWVCSTVLKITVPDLTDLRKTLKISQKKWSASQTVLDNSCSHMMEDLIQKAETALSAKTARPHMRTRTKERVQDSLAALTNRPINSSIPLTPPKSPPTHKMKRKMPIEEIESPSKRATRQTYVPSRLGQDSSTDTPRTRRVDAAASLPTPPQSAVVPDEESENEASNETIVVRSTRKQLPYGAWELQKPTIIATGGEPLTPSTSGRNRPMARVAADASSLGSTALARIIRTRLQVPLAPKGLSYPIQDEEMPRRRRRNLRAAFLTPGVYGWKPAGQTAKKLEQARNWESWMIRKHGDPWDA